MAQCTNCWGSGYAGDCYICNGSGNTPSPDGTYVTSCSSCGGSGKRRCPTCNGSGQVADSSSSSNYSSPSSSGSGGGGGGGGRNRASAANEVIAKYNEAWSAFAAQNYKVAADAYLHVVNTMRDPKWSGYVDEINSLTEAFRKDFKELDEEFSGLCAHAGICYSSYAEEKEKEGMLNEGLTYRFHAIGCYSFSGKHQDLIDSGMQVLANKYAEFGNYVKSKGNTDEANDYFQRAVNIAESGALEYLEKQGIDLSNFKATVDTINRDAWDRFEAKNYGVATYLWKKTADMGDAIGQSNLGNLYYEGLGVPIDYSKSFELLNKAAAQGDAYSLNYMGLHYWNGYAVKTNLNKARGYFKKAVAMGNKTAKENLKALNEANKRNGFVSFIFALAGGIGSAFTIGWVYNNITGAKSFSTIPFLIVLVVGLIITFKAWRNRATILFLIMLALSVPGWLAVTGVIPEHLRTSQTESSQTTAEATATVTSDALNLRAGPSASDDIIKVLKKGDTLTVTGAAENGWVPVTHGNDSGYVSGEMISIETTREKQ